MKCCRTSSSASIFSCTSLIACSNFSFNSVCRLCSSSAMRWFSFAMFDFCVCNSRQLPSSLLLVAKARSVSLRQRSRSFPESSRRRSVEALCSSSVFVSSIRCVKASWSTWILSVSGTFGSSTSSLSLAMSALQSCLVAPGGANAGSSGRGSTFTFSCGSSSLSSTSSSVADTKSGSATLSSVSSSAADTASASSANRSGSSACSSASSNLSSSSLSASFSSSKLNHCVLSIPASFVAPSRGGGLKVSSAVTFGSTCSIASSNRSDSLLSCGGGEASALDEAASTVLFASTEPFLREAFFLIERAVESAPMPSGRP
mmetsp:Transcript_100028/g.173600  ORF Transcript_100028/g.173600 Transcript_100028/m.173600 type:complete len:316 (+) Transcript_100028:589-1536(+)